MTKGLVQIVPKFQPDRDGIGDYALGLAQRLASRGWDSHFLVPNEYGRTDDFEMPEGFRVSARSLRDDVGIRRDVAGADAVILHYVGYGYNRRGVPFRLVGLLEMLKRETLVRPSVVYFHELWASGPPWKSEFYLGPIQRLLEKRIASLGRVSMTSTEIMSRRLQHLTGRNVLVQPISGIVPASRETEQSKSDAVVVFGLPSSRAKTIERHAELIGMLFARGLIQRVIIAGDNAGTEAENHEVQRCLGNVRVEWIDSPDADAVAAILKQAAAFLSYYPAPYLLKSASIMTAFAVGCPVIIASGSSGAPLERDRHYLVNDVDGRDVVVAAFESGRLASIGEAAHSWYVAEADWPIAVKRWEDALEG
jgi:glycosyltransferase involved in cell wall biosynthesis